VLTVSVAAVAGVADAVPQIGPSVMAGEIEQVRVTLPVKPFVGLTVTVEVAEPPGLTVRGERAVAVKEKVWAAA
jgi:hypothetical protein